MHTAENNQVFLVALIQPKNVKKKHPGYKIADVDTQDFELSVSHQDKLVHFKMHSESADFTSQSRKRDNKSQFSPLFGQ